jgi:HAMP domain-containing protein
MGTLSDVQVLYGSVRNTWAKSQAHIIAHVLLALVIFVLFRATLPGVVIPPLDANIIANNEWFKLAKETGFVYACFVFPIIAIAAYVAVLRFAGGMLVALSMLVFPPSPRRKPFHLLTPAMLEPLALTLKKDNFDMGDLTTRSAEFVIKYQSKKNEAWENYQKSIEGLTKNAQVYLGDFLVFALVWVVLFRFTPEAAWVQANQAHFWPVLLVLLGLAWFAWFRVSRAVAAVPSLLLMFVSMMLRTDPDVTPLLEIGEEERTQLWEKLEALLRRERNTADRRPSLRRFVASRLGFSESDSGDKRSPVDRGFPLYSLYERGSRFAWDKKQYEHYNNEWLSRYVAYLYYRLHTRLSNLARTLGQLIRYIVTGAP